MFHFIVFLSAFTACLADIPVTPPIICGETPTQLFTCIGNPKVVKPEVSRQCGTSVSECDRMKCIFRKSDWLDGDSVNKQKVTAHFDQFAKEHPDWAPAVAQVKEGCLTATLPPQGVYVNCPAYDVMQCALTAFIRNATPSQWTSSPSCEYPRQFAAACPVCPTECFAALVPTGSCRACILLPRTPQTP